MKKRLLSVLLAWSVLMGALPVYALEEPSASVPAAPVQEMATVETAAPGQQEPAAQTRQDPEETQEPAAASGESAPVEEQLQEKLAEQENRLDVSDADLPDSDELFALYLQQQMYPDRVPSTLANWGEESGVLNENGLKMYHALRDFFGKVARGELESTEHYRIPMPMSVTYSELGVSGMEDPAFNEAAGNKLNEQAQVGEAIDYLLGDCPAELYWFDKTQSITWDFYNGVEVPGGITVEGVEIDMPIEEAYCTDSIYSANQDKMKSAFVSVQNAQAIAEKYADLPSAYEKLVAFRNEIAALTDYNYEAVEVPTPYGDPWQIVYVFDGDPDTKVVCEGYAKAFQYLCDLAGIPCYTVTGDMIADEASGSHMWNVVPMDGQNYLVDVTNYDQVGFVVPELFMAGASGSVAQGYSITLPDSMGTVTYQYDSFTIQLYGEKGLKLAPDKYVPPEPELSITGLPETIAYGDTFSLQAAHAEEPVSWSATGAVQVDASTGLVTVTGVGEFTITATAADRKASVTGEAVPRSLTVTEVTARNKIYDGTTAAEVSATVDTGVAGDILTITGLQGSFAQKDVGENLTVTVDSSAARWNNDHYELTFPETTTASITPAGYEYAGVTDQEACIGSGLDTVNVTNTAAGVAGELVGGTLTWYEDEDHTRALTDDYRFAGEEGKTVTLYWVFTPDAAYTNYTPVPTTGSTTFALVAKVVPQVSAQGVTKSYDGKAVTLEDLKPQASVPGSWALDASTPELKNAGDYNVLLRFTPDNSQDYATATIRVPVKVEPRLFTLGLELSSNQITTGEELPTARLVWSGALEGEDMTPEGEAVFTGWPESGKAGYYAIQWANCQEMLQALMAKPAAVNYRFQIREYALLTVTQAALLPGSNEKFRLEATEGLPYVPRVLQQAGFPTSQAVVEAMFRYVAQQMSGATLQNTVLQDVNLYYSADGGKTWTQATQDNFPAEGIRVTLPYPDGTNATGFDFVVTHMLTTGTPGAVETPAVTKTDKGLQFTVYSLSPIAVSWTAVETEPEETATAGTDSGSSPAATPAPQTAPASGSTPYYTCPACGYHDWTATDEGYRCDHCGYLESVKQLSGYGNVKGVYTPPTSGSADAKHTASAIAQTGDDSNPALWGVLCLLSALVLGGLAIYRRKRYR